MVGAGRFTARDVILSISALRIPWKLEWPCHESSQVCQSVNVLEPIRSSGPGPPTVQPEPSTLVACVGCTAALMVPPSEGGPPVTGGRLLRPRSIFGQGPTAGAEPRGPRSTFPYTKVVAYTIAHESCDVLRPFCPQHLVRMCVMRRGWRSIMIRGSRARGQPTLVYFTLFEVEVVLETVVARHAATKIARRGHHRKSLKIVILNVQPFGGIHDGNKI